jgi:hypothetical protein
MQHFLKRRWQERAMGQVYRFNDRRANIQQRHRKRPQPKKRSWLPLAFGGSVVVGLIALEFGLPLAGCGVKGNISPNTGERIYHVPSQEYYSQTRINWLNGEHWFCSEDAARKAGWRKAMR